MPGSRFRAARIVPWLAAAASLALGCGVGERERDSDPGNGGGEELGSATLPLCDGSDDMRFAFVAGLGPREAMLLFGAGNGAQFVAIDGRCRFWIYDLTLLGLRSGTLDPEYANGTLASQLRLGAYAGSNPERTVCVDGGGEWIWDTTGTLVSSCGGSTESGLFGEVLTRAEGLLDELAPRSTPAWERTSLLPLHEGTRGPGVPVAPRPAALDLGSASIGAIDYSNSGSAPDGLLVDDAATLDVLRALRLSASAQTADGDEYLYPGLFLSDPDAGELQVLLRDEPPPAVAQVIDAIVREN